LPDIGASEPALLQRERAIVRFFRKASAYRARVEAECAARLKKLDDEHKQATTSISERLKRIQDVVNSAQSALGNVDQRHLLMISNQHYGRAVPLSEVESGLASAKQASQRVQQLAERLKQVQRNKKASVPGGAAFLGVLNLLAGGICIIGMFSALSNLAANGAASASFILMILGTALIWIGVGLFLKQEWARIFAIIELLSGGIFTWFFIPYFFKDEVKSVFKADKNDGAVISEIQGQANQIAAAFIATKAWHDAALTGEDQSYQQKRAATLATNQQELSAAKTAYEGTLAQMRQNLQQVAAQAGLWGAAWSDAAWQSWTPTQEDTGVPPTVRAGTITQVGGLANPQHEPLLPASASQVFMPLLLPFVSGQRPLLIKATGAARAAAIGAIQSLLVRLLATLPPGKVRFTFIDPIGLGQNVAPFMQLGDHDEALITGKAWTEPQHIEQRLADLTEHMENVIQKYLRNEYESIEQYNEKAGEVAEPYRVLVAVDFPRNFSDAGARRLVSIAANGPRCGVYAITLVDTAQPLPYGFNLSDLEQTCTVLTWEENRFVWEDDDFRNCDLALDTAPDPQLVDSILETVGAAAVEASKVEVPFERIAPKPDEWWKGDTSAGLHVALGPSGARKQQYLDLGKGTAQHVLVVGKTGSGKSTLLHTLITNLALAESPDQVELYLIDFKKGVEFKTYAEHQLPHARVIAIESEREFGLSVLQRLDGELKRRGDLFRKIGVDSLSDYRDKARERMPRILLLVDEFQEYFTEDDPLASQASQILDRLVRQGRAFGIHVLLGSQTLAGAYTLARSTIDQMAVRIALQCSEADSRLILADDNPAARLLSRAGEAIYNAANGMVEGNNRFQVALLRDAQRDGYLRQIQDLARIHHYRPPFQQIIFEGNAPADVKTNRPLQDLLAAPTWPAPARTVRAWLGEPIAIRDEPVAATFRRQSGSNLLIVGQDDKAALGIMGMALVSLAAQHHPGQPGASFAILDFGAVDAPDAESKFLSHLAESLPHSVMIGRRRELPDMIAALAAEAQRRLSAAEDAEGRGMGSAPIYLFLYGLQRARDLRQDESFGYAAYGSEAQAPNPSQQFATLVREGPDVGIHTIIWCDTMTNLNRSLDRRAQREFAMRIAFQMGAEDSANLLDVPVASKLGPNRALYSSEDEGLQEKFRPYALPTEAWIAGIGKQLRAKRAI
jgi:S-DNA-T family DNA segregation ATPase FtsK/SpoIIIE